MTVRHFLLLTLLLLKLTCYVKTVKFQGNISHKSVNNEFVTRKMLGQSESSQNSTKNVCIDGKDITKQSKKEYLEAFIRGPCAPTIVIGGIFGTRLKITIHCEEFKQNNPFIFEQCGWSTCDKLQKGSPKSSYVIFLPTQNSKINPINNKSGLKCFSNLVKDYKKIKDGKITQYNLKGIKVSVNYKEKGKKDRSCGWSAVDKILKYKIYDGKYLLDLQKKLKHMGYLSGLTVQPFPYDWRLDTKTILKNDKFNTIAKNQQQMVSKKVTIIAHSYGNIVTYRSLMFLDQNERRRIYGNFVSIAPPFQGAHKPFKMQTSNKPIDIGHTLRKSFNNFSSVYELLPKDIFYRFKSTEWQTEIKKLIKIYKNQLTTKTLNSKSFSFLPNKDNCKYDPKSKKFPENCSLGLIKMEKLAKANNYQYSIKQLPEFLHKFPPNDHASLESVYYDDHRLLTFHNIKIPSFVVFTTKVPTISNIEFKGHVKRNQQHIIKNNLKEIYQPGDGTVLSTSAIIPFLKWAKEKQDGIVSDAEPIKFVSYCSPTNQSKEAYSTQNSNKKFVNGNNEFIGLDCSCSKTQNYENCGHTGMLNDPNLLNFIEKTLINNDRKEVPEFIVKDLKNNNIQDFVKKCDLSRGNYLKGIDSKLDIN